MLVIFPFEAPFYRARGVDAEFVGHPLATLALPTVSREEYAARHGLDPAKKWIALLPGSRQKEIKSNLPEMVMASTQLNLKGEYQCVFPVASTIDRHWLDREMEVREFFADKFGGGIPPKIALVADAREALFHAQAAVVASGTATVQALTVGNPFVVVYRVSALTFAVAKRMIRYPKEIPAQGDEDGNLPVGMVNLIAGRRIVPELLNKRFTAANLAAALRPLLDDTPKRCQMIADLAEARAKLLPEAASNPIGRVCDAVEDLLKGVSESSPRSVAGNV
jgi:lipid-A-disaccharide synthase